MRIVKKVIMVSVLALALTACGKAEQEKNETGNEKKPEVTTVVNNEKDEAGQTTDKQDGTTNKQEGSTDKQDETGEKTKGEQPTLGEVVGDLLGVGYLKYIDKSKAATEKMNYEHFCSYSNVAATAVREEVLDGEYQFTITAEKTILTLNGKEVSEDDPFRQEFMRYYGDDYRDVKKKLELGYDYVITIKPDKTVERTKEPVTE